MFLDLHLQKFIKVIQTAEKLGFTQCWVYDQGLVTRDPYISLAAVALSTDKMKLGVGITNPYIRHPGVTAAAFATLDELSAGRAIMGVGAGGFITLDPMAIPQYKPLTAVRELISSSRALFRGEKLTYQGKTVNFSSAIINYARPDIEIWVAGKGPKMLAMGGELADGVILECEFKDNLIDLIGLIRTGASRSGNKPKICFSTAIITSQEALEEFRPHMTYRLIDSPPQTLERLGVTMDDIEQMRTLTAKGGIKAAGKVVKDEWIAPFVVMGSPKECAQELTDLMHKHKMDLFLLPILETTQAERLINEVSLVIKEM